MSRTEYFSDPAAYFELVFDPRVSVKNVRIINDNLVAVTYQYGDDFVEVLSNTNPVIAAFTTAQARLKLYSYIEQLQERVLYFDTGTMKWPLLSNADNLQHLKSFRFDYLCGSTI